MSPIAKKIEAAKNKSQPSLTTNGSYSEKKTPEAIAIHKTTKTNAELRETKAVKVSSTLNINGFQQLQLFTLKIS